MRSISIVFFIFLMLLVMPGNLNQSSIVKSDNLKNDYNEVVDNATSDAAKALIIPSENYSTELMADGKSTNYQKTNLNLSEGLNRFYKSIYLNLGIQDNGSQQKALVNKIPIIIAAGYDGYYIHTWQENKGSDGKLKIINDWTNKKLYSIKDNKYNIKIHFTLDNYVYIENLNNNQKYEGNAENFSSKYPEYFGINFTKVRSQIINQMIQKDLNYYTYSNNKIAKKNGWSLKFNVPYWGDRSITTISFIAFLQGKIMTGAPNNYDTYGFGTAKIVARKPIYGYLSSDGHKFYSTNKIGTYDIEFYNMFEAAKNGYSPDPKYYK